MRVLVNSYHSFFRHFTRLRINKKHIVYIASILMLIVTFISLTPLMPTRASAASPATTRSKLNLARMSEEVSVRAAGRGAPYINLSDGHEVFSDYSGPQELVAMLESKQAKGRSLASADFDEDGVPDLVSGYAGPGDGIITLLRGNVDSIYPNTPEAKQRKAEGMLTDAPFLSPAFVFSVPEAVDFVGAGDFDGDSHWDVVAARHGGSKLYLLSGNGKGSLSLTRTITLQGEVTAMIIGEINRRDGLADIVVGINGEAGAKVLVFEGPEGALKAKPEEFALSAVATSLALGPLDEEYTYDLAIAAGRELMIVHGRDRKLSLNIEQRAKENAARIDRWEYPYEIGAVEIGEFRSGANQEIACLCGDGKLRLLSQKSGAAQENAVQGDESPEPGKQPISPEIDRLSDTNKSQTARAEKIAEPKPISDEWEEEIITESEWSANARLIKIRTSSVPLDNVAVLDKNKPRIEITFKKNEQGSLIDQRGQEKAHNAWIETDSAPIALLPMRLNTDALSDLVMLKEGQSSPVVSMTAAQAIFTVTTILDNGDDSSPTPNSLRAAIISANNNPGTDIINFRIGTGVKTIAPPIALPIIREAVVIDGTSQPGYAGTPLIEINGSSAGDAYGLAIAQGNSTIKGLVINRFQQSGVIFYNHTGNNLVLGNYFGTNTAGNAGLGNGGNGILIGDAASVSTDNTIGGTTSAARNVISGNHVNGIYIFSANPAGNRSTRNLVKGNYIGTNASGTGAIGNLVFSGVIMQDSPDNTIGGTEAGARNIASGNIQGVRCNMRGATGNLIQGNYIGTNADGTSALGNLKYGVLIDSSLNNATTNGSSSNTVGGTVPSARNLISGNGELGIFIEGNFSTNNQVQGNYIGTNRDGTVAIGNGTGSDFGDGVFIQETSGNVVGGVISGARNIVSGNHRGVVIINNSPGNPTLIQGNFIGTNPSGTQAVPNSSNGIIVTNAPGTIIGDNDPNARNIISGNRQHGIAIGFFTTNPLTSAPSLGGTGATVRGNYIGTDFTGTLRLGNGLCGVFVEVSCARHIIENNLIAFNGSAGICLPNISSQPGVPPVQIEMRSNSISSNAGLGIDLGPTGPTPNPGNRLTGANNLQNFPELSSAIVSSHSLLRAGKLDTSAIVTVKGTLNASPNTTYKLEFFLVETCQAGQGTEALGKFPLPLGTRNVTTGADGIKDFSFDLSLPPTDFQSGLVNATATDPARNTSEQSFCQPVSGTLPLVGPSITNVVKDGKNFIVTGAGFVGGAKLLINGVEKKTRVDSAASIFSKKGAKAITYPAHLQVRNPDNSLSNEYTFNLP